jgi:phosphopantothenoylcysteine decarboxylase/phosphopantothenate--cysteine ligase
MDGGMYSHPATQDNLRILKERGAIVLGPAEGHLASGLTGPGRMVEPLEILDHIRYHFSRDGQLKGKKVVVTAGGTREAIDPVRFITNRSSGKQGYAVAQAALDAGADVTLVSTASLPAPVGAKVVYVENAAEMLKAVGHESRDAHVLVMAAAVADFTPQKVQQHKIKKDSGTPSLVLQPTADILKTISENRKKTGFPRYLVGFAAESEDLIRNAQKKLDSKGLDLVVANDIMSADAGFEVDTNRVVLLSRTGEPQTLPLMSKQEAAVKIIDLISQWD